MGSFLLPSFYLVDFFNGIVLHCFHLNRPLPPVPNLEISDETIDKAADAARVFINRLLAVAHDIAIKRDAKLFLQVCLLSYLISPPAFFHQTLLCVVCNFFFSMYAGRSITLACFIYWEPLQLSYAPLPW